MAGNDVLSITVKCPNKRMFFYDKYTLLFGCQDAELHRRKTGGVGKNTGVFFGRDKGSLSSSLLISLSMTIKKQ